MPANKSYFSVLRVSLSVYFSFVLLWFLVKLAVNFLSMQSVAGHKGREQGFVGREIQHSATAATQQLTFWLDQQKQRLSSGGTTVEYFG